MSEPRRISPMLDGCLVGDAISCHNGVSCYPAIREMTGEKHIVKILSVPASQVQLEALLLTGALPNKDAAREYFHQQAKDLIRESEILRQMSHQEGFVPYLDGQIVAMSGQIGYEVYLLGTYKQSLERMLRTDTMTHQGVVNMALDLCAALAACRRAGYLYVALKPSNVFYTESKGYQIGDLGFISLSSLKYASLPEKYRSCYIAPEIADDFAVLNSTVDIYALGLVLYQACNGGVLPFAGTAPSQVLEPPLYADYELAEIILKACAPDPSQRWQDPAQMAQALVEYMQRNDVTDAPLIPPTVQVTEPADGEEDTVEEFLPEEPIDLDAEPIDDELAFMDALVSDETAPNEENTAALTDAPISQDISEMLAQAEDLIAHPLPDPVVAPEPIDVPMPPPIEPEPEPEPEAESEPEPEPDIISTALPESAPEVTNTDAPAEEPEPAAEIETPAEAETKAPAEAEQEAMSAVKPEPKKKILFPNTSRETLRKWGYRAVGIVLIVFLAASALFGYHYYTNIYLQNVDDLIISGNADMLSVQVISDIDDSLLTVVCTDSYGNSSDSPVVAGVAVFTQLNPQTRYTIRVKISGNHKLTGTTSDSYTTTAQTEIKDFTASIGPVNGSVKLNFIAEGSDSKSWIVKYSAQDVPEQSVSFAGHTVTISNLEIGKDYTFTLSSTDSTYLTGETSVVFTASNILYAENVVITACGDGALTVQWNAPDSQQSVSWIVRCYNAEGYSQIITTEDTFCTFTEIDPRTGYTVDVVAAGMNQSVSASIGADPITIKDFVFGISDESGLTVSWNYSGSAPADGWIILYTIDNSPQQILKTSSNSASFYALPGGHYTFTIQTPDDRHIFGASTTYGLSEVGIFTGFGITADDLQTQMCVRPIGETWSYNEVPAEAYRQMFAKGETGALILSATAPFDASDEAVEMLFILHNGEEVLVHSDSLSIVWNDMWEDGYFELDIPYFPTETGAYNLTIYMNGGFVTEQPFFVE